MEIFAYLASALIGISLGLIGGGGSILTVPVMVYLFGVSPLIATSYSLFIVGSTSLVGAYQNFRNGYVDVKIALLFGISSISTVFLTRQFIIPAIPKQLFRIGSFQVTENVATMVLFAILMLAASTAMIRDNSVIAAPSFRKKEIDFPKLLIYGVAIGFTTGLLGAGGGFLLIPTLVILLGLPMKEAVGTSLLIIGLNSLIGFTGDLGHFAIDWLFLIKITFIAIIGIIVGSQIHKRVEGSKLKKGFGWFVLLMGAYILVKELFIKNIR